MLLAKYGNISISDSDNMVPFERRAVYRLLSEHIKEQNEEIEKAREKARSKRKSR